MAEEKMICCCPSKGKIFTVLGVLAIVWGIINYLIAVVGWSNYAAWITGGIILLLVAWAKKSMSKS